MPVYFKMAHTPAELAAWGTHVAFQTAAARQALLYDSGPHRMLLTIPQGGAAPCLIPLPAAPGPSDEAELVADELAARSLLEDTRIPRRPFWLRVIITVPGPHRSLSD